MSTTPSNPQPSGMFSEPPAQRAFPTSAVAIACVAIAILVGFLVLLSRRHSDPPSAAYAPNIILHDIQMSESTSLSGGKSTYIDGKVLNHGPATVTAINIQASFHNDEAMPPQIVSVPLALIRAHEPYVDTQPVSSNPLAPGADREFRLIFENIGSNWNQQQPEIHVTSVQVR